jgi:uncharacterized membrane protein
VFDRHFVPHWGSLGAVVIAAVLAAWIDVAYARVVAMLGLGFWLVLNILGMAELLDWYVASGMTVLVIAGLLFWAIGTALAAFPDRPRIASFGLTMLWPGVAGVLVALGILQASVFWTGSALDDPLWFELAVGGLVGVLVLTGLSLIRRQIGVLELIGAVAIGIAAIAFAWWSPEDTVPARLAGGVLVLAACLYVVHLGQTGSRHIGKKLGLAAFGIELIYLYVETLGTLLDTALAFLIGGLLFMALAYALYRVDKRLTANAGAAA